MVLAEKVGEGGTEKILMCEMLLLKKWKIFWTPLLIDKPQVPHLLGALESLLADLQDTGQ